MDSRHTATPAGSKAKQPPVTPAAKTPAAATPPKPQVPSRCPKCNELYDMSMQVDLVRCCLKCGLVVNFADAKGLEQALASRVPATPPARRIVASGPEDEPGFWKRRVRPKRLALIGFGLVVLYLIFWGITKMGRINEAETLKMLRGPQFEDHSDEPLKTLRGPQFKEGDKK